MKFQQNTRLSFDRHGLRRIKIKTKEILVKYLRRVSNLPWIARVVTACLFCFGGLFFFLPVLGIWMLPLGLLTLGLCIPVTDRMIVNWLGRLEAEIQVDRSVENHY